MKVVKMETLKIKLHARWFTVQGEPLILYIFTQLCSGTIIAINIKLFCSSISNNGQLLFLCCFNDIFYTSKMVVRHTN